MMAELLRWRDGSNVVPRFAGWFNKLGSGRLDGWRRRYFVMDGRFLRYFVSEGGGNGAEEKGRIEIRAGTTVFAEGEDVTIKSPGLRREHRIRLMAGSPAENRCTPSQPSSSQSVPIMFCRTCQ